MSFAVITDLGILEWTERGLFAGPPELLDAVNAALSDPALVVASTVTGPSAYAAARPEHVAFATALLAVERAGMTVRESDPDTVPWPGAAGPDERGSAGTVY